MKGNGRTHDFIAFDEAAETPSMDQLQKMRETLDAAPVPSNRIQADAIMECDFCFRPMDFNEYSTHECEALGGRNPFAEKMRNAKWQVPGVAGFIEDTRGIIGGTVRARGRIIGEQSARYMIRGLLGSVVVAVILLLLWAYRG